MKLISLKLLNFRTFRKEEVLFKDNFSIIFGLNGSGKTSITDAIGLALFGTRGLDFSRLKASKLQSFFSGSKEPSKIELTFNFGGNIYSVSRVINKGTKSFESDFITAQKDVFIGPGVEITGGDEIKNFIEGLLGVSKDIFVKSIFARQKDLQILSSDSKRPDRIKLINSVLGISKLEDFIRQIKEDKNAQKNIFDDLKKDLLNIDLDKIFFDKKILKEEGDLINTQIKKQEKELKKFNSEFEKIKENYGNISKTKEKYDEFSKNISIGESKILHLEKDIKAQEEEFCDLIILQKDFVKNKGIYQEEKLLQQKIDEIKEVENKLSNKKNIEKNIEKTNETIKNIETEISNFFTSIALSEKSMNGLNIEKEKIKKGKEKSLKSIETLKLELTTICTKKDIVQQKGKDLNKELAEILKLSDKAECPTCKRLLNGHTPKLKNIYELDINKKREEWKILKNEADILSLKIEKENKILESQQKKSKNLENIEKNILEKKSTLLVLFENIRKYNTDLKDIGELVIDFKQNKEFIDRYDLVKKEVSRLKIIEGKIARISKLTEQKNINTKALATEQNKLSDAFKAIEKLDFNIEIYKKTKDDYEEYNDNLAKKQKNIRIMEKQSFGYKEKMLEINLKIKEFTEKKDKFNTLTKNISKLEVKEGIIKDYSIYLLNSLKPHIELLASDYFHIITDGKYADITLDKDYKINIDGKSLELYSGGEKDLANLCLRLALGQNLSLINTGNQINFLILDEILGSQDKKRQMNILASLKKLEYKFSQILLITHLDDVKELASNLIEVRPISNQESIIKEY